MRPIAIDATTLSILLNPAAKVPLDATGVPVDFGRERILGFIAQAEKERRKLIIPTPATAELLTAIGPTSAKQGELQLEEHEEIPSVEAERGKETEGA